MRSTDAVRTGWKREEEDARALVTCFDALLARVSPMRLNRFSDYGLRALIYLGTHKGRRVTTEEISNAYRISRSHLQKIIRELGRLGIVAMHRGRSGGLELAKDPKEISIGLVLRALDSDTRLVECFDPERDQCTISPVCGLKQPLAAAEEAFFASLDPLSLNDVLGPGRTAQLRSLLGPEDS